jgi:hypothetical protein
MATANRIRRRSGLDFRKFGPDRAFADQLRMVLAAARGRGRKCWHRQAGNPFFSTVGTPIAVQQKLMRHTDIRTTFNIYGDVVTNEMAEASSKVAGLACNSKLSR